MRQKVLACQSFGECTARVKLELTDFSHTVGFRINTLQVFLWAIGNFLQQFPDALKSATLLGLHFASLVTQLIGRLFSPSQKLKKLTQPFRICFELGMGTYVHDTKY